ncbi:MAG: hypothetical protein QXG39_08955, partial [Candidatus Aenigmatarchaeota archaeon]
IVGYAISSPAINPYMIFGAIAVPILMALAATPIYFQSQMMKLRNREAEIKTKLEDIKAKILKISELGYNIKTLEKRLYELNLGISDPKMSEFYKNKMFHAAATHLNNIMGDSLKLEEETDNLLNRIAQIEEKVHSIESNIDEIKSIIRKTEKLIYQVSMSEERKELEEIQKRLTNITNMAKKGLFEEALNNLETLKTKSETLDDEVSEIYEFWSKVPQWSKAIEEKLKAEGKAELKAISEIPEKWKNQAANYFLKERKDEELTFKNGVIYSSKIIPSPATAKKEIESIEIKTTVTKPTPKEEIDTKVFRYIQEHQGTISIKKALEDLKLSEEEFRESVRRLKEKRLIE